MVHKGDLVVIGICVGLALGIRWYKKHAYLWRCAIDESVPTHPIHINGFGTSTEFSTSLSNSVDVKGSEYSQKSSQVSWWSNHNKDRFASASGISTYPYKLLIKCKLDCWITFGRDGYRFWRASHSGCVLHGNMELAKLVVTKVFGLDPEEFYQAVLLSNVYASVGRFQDAEAVRSSKQKKGLIKTPGNSFLNSSSCEFG